MGLSPAARRTLTREVQARVADAWTRDRALVLNANKPGYSESFTIAADQYTLLRSAILDGIEVLADENREASLQAVIAFVSERLHGHPSFPGGRFTNYVRYVKVDLEARGEVARVPGRSPQHVRRLP